jgi:hypothetical protein
MFTLQSVVTAVAHRFHRDFVSMARACVESPAGSPDAALPSGLPILDYLERFAFRLNSGVILAPQQSQYAGVSSL